MSAFIWSSVADPTAVRRSLMAAEWKRVLKGGWNSTATDRVIDEAEIVELLTRRTGAKKKKDYKTADEIARTLQEKGIAYVDEKLEYYTKADKPKPMATAKASTNDHPKATENKRKRTDDKVATAPAAGEADDDDQSSEDDDDSEDDREDDALVAKMRYAIVKAAHDKTKSGGSTSISSSSSSSSSSSDGGGGAEGKREKKKEKKKSSTEKKAKKSKKSH